MSAAQSMKFGPVKLAVKEWPLESGQVVRGLRVRAGKRTIYIHEDQILPLADSLVDAKELMEESN